MRFNTNTRGQNRTKNHEGALAYTISAKKELYAATAATLLADQFYERADGRLTRIRELVAKISTFDPAFVAKLAVYAREQMHLRSIPLVLTVELAKVHRGDDLVRRMTRRVVARADEITELLAYYQLANARTGQKRLHKLSKQLQHGLADAFNRFDAYQFAKYNRKTEVTLRDALFLVHPRAKDAAQQAIFDKLANDTLAAAYTWESEMSKAGQVAKEMSAEDKQVALREKWEELLRSGKVGYMALLRNLRNLLQADVAPELLQLAADRIADPQQLRRAKQFPFRFLAAYRELQAIDHLGTARLLQALEDAMTASAANIQGFEAGTRVALFSDLSGSMGNRLSAKGSLSYMEVGLTLAALFHQTCAQVITGVFGQTYQTVQLNPSTGTLANVEQLKRTNVGHATNGYLAIKHLVEKEVVVDKVLVFTDCQLWDSKYLNTETIAKYWQQYKRIAPQAKLYLFDLTGYGNTPLDTQGSDAFLITGWSDKVFEILEAIENKHTAVQVIEQLEL